MNNNLKLKIIIVINFAIVNILCIITYTMYKQFMMIIYVLLSFVALFIAFKQIKINRNIRNVKNITAFFTLLNTMAISYGTYLIFSKKESSEIFENISIYVLIIIGGCIVYKAYKNK